MKSEDKSMFENVLKEMKPDEVEGFLIVLKFKKGDTKSYCSDMAVELFDYIKNVIEANRKFENGEWSQEDMDEYFGLLLDWRQK